MFISQSFWFRLQRCLINPYLAITLGFFSEYWMLVSNPTNTDLEHGAYFIAIRPSMQHSVSICVAVSVHNYIFNYSKTTNQILFKLGGTGFTLNEVLPRLFTRFFFKPLNIFSKIILLIVYRIKEEFFLEPI